MMVKPRGFDSPSIPVTALMPRNAGSIIAKPNGSSVSASTVPSSARLSTVILPASTFFTRVEVIHLM